MSDEIITGAELSRRCGVSRAAVSLAVKRGNLIKNEDGQFDMSHPDNLAYFLNKMDGIVVQEQPKKQEKKTIAKKPSDKIDKPRPREIKIDSSSEFFDSLNGINIEKGKRDIKIKDITIARLSGEVIPREMIQPIWNKIYRSAAYFSEFPSRYAGEYAAALGVTDPDRIHQLEKVIGASVENFISDFANSVLSAVDG